MHDTGRPLALAEAQGLLPAVGFALRRGALTLPPEPAERAARALAVGSARHLIFGTALSQLLRAFRAAGIPLIPLKGAVLAETVYPHPALRALSDLDLLVRRQDVHAADERLRALGFRRMADAHSWSFDVAYDEATVYESPTGVRVDLHWGLVGDPRYPGGHAAGRDVWTRAAEGRLAGEAALLLAPEDLVLHLAVHLAVHHALQGLRWYWDLALVLRRLDEGLDWDAVLERARRWRVCRALHFVLAELDRLFGVRAPAAVAAAVAPHGPRAALVAWLLARDGGRVARLDHVVAPLLADRARDLCAPLARAVCPAPAWLAARYDGRSLLARYGAHCRRLSAIAGAMVSGRRV